MDFHRVIPGLSQRIGLDHTSTLGIQHRALPVDLGQGLRLPVLDLKDQYSAVGMQDDEVGMSVTGSDRYVVPAHVIVFELVLKTL